MKKIFFLLLSFLAISVSIRAQKLMKIVYVKDGVVTSNAKEANLLIAIRSVDGRYERNDYTLNGPLIRVKTFKDMNQTILEGNYLEYDKNGNLQLAGYYTNNVKSGNWLHFNDSGKIVNVENFGGTGIFDGEANYHDSANPPLFKGGKNEWRNYLHETLNRDAMSNMLKDEEVNLSFTITETGTLKNFILFRSEYFLVDNEFISVVNKSPKWKPALYMGKPVSYRYFQNLLMFDQFYEN
jgi:antitoxin component YwqK of YwqJK toxin-antitoxin module